MIDLTDFATRVNIGVGLALVVVLLFLIFLAKFPSKRTSKR
ncbi:MAG: hypothetical protein US99_C0011G0014 [Candidatus Daviesbacteria bacterium GW2011_GWF2_38_6]|uniref:Uncharacterized protein n=1 Tax=Candidatus Daviesbacteria bacterium GW2011_GWF2_38_6 TaxID=1618432 RepID=A0A0G0MYT7_9BACT|nr:MAG: hypothetical protein US99_C0011G0014 [Candidatus Daviesbacteria bacterium GW2011_GWF2_38_6]